MNQLHKPETMPKIRIACKARWSYDLRIYLDDQIIGILPLNETREIDLPAGEHKLKAKLGFYGSKDYLFTLFNKERRSFTISKNYVWIILFISFITIITALKTFTAQNKGVLLGFIVIGLVYFLLIRRDSFLKIKEEEQE
jgi:hypothetical protein